MDLKICDKCRVNDPAVCASCRDGCNQQQKVYHWWSGMARRQAMLEIHSQELIMEEPKMQYDFIETDKQVCDNCWHSKTCHDDVCEECFGRKKWTAIP